MPVAYKWFVSDRCHNLLRLGDFLPSLELYSEIFAVYSYTCTCQHIRMYMYVFGFSDFISWI